MLLKIYERQYDKDGKLKTIDRPIKNPPNPGQKVRQTVADVYYMDLNDEEEALMRETGTFGFERVMPNQLDKVNKKELERGLTRKNQIFSSKAKARQS